MFFEQQRGTTFWFSVQLGGLLNNIRSEQVAMRWAANKYDDDGGGGGDNRSWHQSGLDYLQLIQAR